MWTAVKSVSIERRVHAGELLRLAEFVERDEQASGESGYEKESRFVEPGQVTGETGYGTRTTLPTVFRLERASNAFRKSPSANACCAMSLI